MAHGPVDYEAAWHDLAATVEARPSGWGTRNLLAEMTRIAAKHRVSEGLYERFARLFGVEAVARLINQGDRASGAGGTPPTGVRATAPDIEEVTHDGSSNGRTPAAVG